MQVLPVIDLKNGEVVRGVGGQREIYQRVESLLVSEATVGSVARAFANQLLVDTIYVADLDAIAGHDPDWSSLQQIQQAGLNFWLDAGAGTRVRVEQLLDEAQHHLSLDGLIVGLESVPNESILQDLWKLIGAERAIFSLDLKHGVPLTGEDGWKGQGAREIAGKAVAIGFQRVIVLDLAAVGMGQGTPVEALCADLHQAHPGVEWISGGGVRDLRDLKRLADHGCAAALVASALHDGRLGVEELNEARCF